jgi:lysyl-tRNA synthetase class II
MVETSIAYEDDVVVERRARELKVKQEAYTLEFVENLHAGLTNQLLEDPKQLEKLYQKLCRDLSRKHKYMMNKAEINKIYQELLKTGRVAPSFIVDSVTKNKSVRSR